MAEPGDDWLQRALAELKAGQGAQPATPAPGQHPVMAKLVAEVQAGEADWAARALSELPEYAKDPGAWEQTKAGAQGLASGLVTAGTQTLGDLPQNLGTLVSRGLLNIADALGMDVPRHANGEIIFDEPAAWNPAAAIQRAGNAAQEALTPDSLRLQDSLAFRGGQMLGASVPMVAGAALGGMPVAAALGAAQQAGASAQDAAASGASPMATMGALFAGGALGAAGALPLEIALGRIATQAGPGLARKLAAAGERLPGQTARVAADAGVRGVVGTAEGAASGAAAGAGYVALSNAIHNWATDDDIPLLMGAGEGAGFGAVLGGVIRGATEAAMVKRRLTGRHYSEAGWEGLTVEEMEARGLSSEHGIVPRGGDEMPAMKGVEHPVPEQSGGGDVDPRVARDIMREGRAERSAELIQELDAANAGKPAPDTQPYNESGVPARLFDEKGKEISVRRPRADPMSTPKEYVGTRFNEHGIEIMPDDSHVRAAPKRSAEFAANVRASMNPVTDPVSGRTLVTDIGITDANGQLVGGTGLRVTLDDTFDARAAPILRADVIAATSQAVQKLADFAIRTKLVPEGWAGFYDPKTRVARIAKYGDVLTAAHEAGHAVETIAFGKENSPALDKKWPLIESELTKLGRALYGPAEPPNGYVSEGFAEFMKLYLGQHENLMAHAGETTRWFESTFLNTHPEFAKALDEARVRFDQYRFQGSAKRTTVIDPTDFKTRFRATSKDDVLFRFKRAWIETGQILYEQSKAAVERGINTKRGESAYENFTALRGTADAALHESVNDATFTANGVRSGESYRQVVATMRGKKPQADLDRYLGLRASEWRATQKTRVDPETGERVLAHHEAPFPGIDITHQMAELEARYPQIRGVSDALLAWYDRVIDYAVSRNPEMRPVYDALRQEGEFYMPLKRWSDWHEQTNRTGSGIKTQARMSKVAKHAKGSTRETVSPLLALQVEARNVIQRSHEAAIQKAVIDEAHRAGLSEYVLDVTDDIKRMALVKASLEANGAPIAADAVGDVSAMPLMELQAFMLGAIDTKEGPIVPRRQPKLTESGALAFETRWYQFHPEMHKAVLSSDPGHFQIGLPYLGAILRASKASFVMGATGMRASFGLITNPIRDAQSLFVNSRYNPHLIPLVAQLAYEHGRVGLNRLTRGAVPYEWVKAYDRLGLQYTGRYGSFEASKKVTREAGRTIAGRAVHTLLTPKGWVEVLAELSSISEKGTRIWEMKRSAEAAGWKPGEPMTPEQAVRMAVDARQVTVDFAAGGSIAQKINEFIPFFNATIQGPRGSLRALKNDPLNWALSTATLSALGLWNYLAYKDEDWMQALQPWERWSYWHIPFTAVDGTKGLVRIPVAPDAGFIAKSVEFMADGLASKNPLAFEDWTTQVALSMSMDALPPLAAETALQWANRADFGSDRQIVPENQLNKTATGEMQPGEQVGPYTGRLSIAVGKALNVSPRRIDHMMKGLFAGVGASVSDSTLFGLVQYKPRTEEPRDMPIAGILFRRGGQVSLSSRWISELYDLAPPSLGAYRMMPSADTLRAKLLLENATQAVSFGSVLLEEGVLTLPQRQQIQEEINAIAKDAVMQIRGKATVEPRETMRRATEFEVEVKRLRAAQEGRR